MSELDELIPRPQKAAADSALLMATVTGVSPLAIRLDGDTSSLPHAPSSLISGYLVTGQRVMLARLGSGLLIVGAVGGACPKDVGDILITEDATHPEDRWPGTEWAAYGPGQTIVGLDAGQTEFDTVGETGGAKTHTLTEAQLPAHAHVSPVHVSNDWYGAAVGTGAEAALNGDRYGRNKYTNNTGSGQAHNNLQPYIVAYLWKRTA